LENKTHKKFGWAFSGGFKTFFNQFGQNISVAMGLVIFVFIFMVPYVASIFNLAWDFNYSLNIPTPKLIGLGLSILLLLVVSSFIYPALLTGYFAPKSVDVLEQKQRTKKERIGIMFSSFKKIFPATFLKALVILIPLLGYYLFFFLRVDDTLWVTVAYDIGSIVGVMAVYISVMIVSYFLSYIFLFANQVAFFEEKTGWQSLKRSVNLTLKNKNFWPTLGEYVLIYIAVIAMMYILIIPGIILFAVAWIPFMMYGTLLALLVIAGIFLFGLLVFASAAMAGVLESSVCLLYLNARARAEGTPIPETQIVE